MKIGIDLDGTITRVGLYNPNIRLPWWLFCLLVPFLLLLKPDKMVIEKLQTLKDKGCEIVIVTARPIQLARITKQWLLSHYVPFDQLFCVGFGKGTEERKLKIINDKKIEIFIDNDQSCIEFLKNNSIKAVNKTEYFN